MSNIGAMTIAVLESLNQNPRNRFDVNNDGFISPVDVLIVINHLNSRPVSPLPATLPANYMDVDGSGFVSPNDILQVINFLNLRAGRGSAEGESGTSSHVASLAMPSVTIPFSGTIDAENMNQKSVRDYDHDLLSNSSVQTRNESAFSSISGIFEDSDPDDESAITSVAFEISSKSSLSTKNDTLDSVLDGVLDELGIE